MKILKAIAWFTNKLKFIERITFTVTAFVKSIGMFEKEANKIWSNEKINVKSTVADIVNNIANISNKKQNENSQGNKK